MSDPITSKNVKYIEIYNSDYEMLISFEIKAFGAIDVHALCSDAFLLNNTVRIADKAALIEMVKDVAYYGGIDE